MDNELYHHGILGQKWGVRRFQNEDGSLTAAGRKRYNVGVENAKERVKAAKREQNAAAKAVNPFSKDFIPALQKELKAEDKVRWERQKLASEKAKAGLNKENGSKSKHRLKLEQYYRDKGMSQEEAEIAAYKRSKTEKIIAVVAGATVASAAAYVAYKQYDKAVDKMIKPGTTLQNISNYDNKSVSDAFYFSMTKNDNLVYRGWYGDQLSSYGKVFETTYGVNKTMKVASDRNAVKTLRELVRSDPKNAQLLKDYLLDGQNEFSYGKLGKVMDTAVDEFNKGKVNQKVYDAFNALLPNSHKEEINQKFYNLLKSKGYDAIMDINDIKYGYETSKPMIAFNAGKKATIKAVRELGNQEIRAAKAEATSVMDRKDKISDLVKNKLLKGVKIGLVGLASAGYVAASVKAAQNKTTDDIVKEYKKEHPNTKLSYNEIVDQYYNS